MKKIFTALSLVTLLSTAALAQDAPADSQDASNQNHADAATNYYGELGFVSLRGKNPKLFTGGGSFKPKMLRGVLGKPITPWLNGELMLGIGSGGEQVRRLVPAATSADVEVKTLVGLYATPTLQLGKGKVFARLGYANITYSDVNIPAPGPIVTQGIFSKHDSLSWGLGGSIDLSPNFSLNADYMTYYKRKGEKLDGFTIGLGYKF